MTRLSRWGIAGIEQKNHSRAQLLPAGGLSFLDAAMLPRFPWRQGYPVVKVRPREVR